MCKRTADSYLLWRMNSLHPGYTAVQVKHTSWSTAVWRNSYRQWFNSGHSFNNINFVSYWNGWSERSFVVCFFYFFIQRVILQERPVQDSNHCNHFVLMMQDNAVVWIHVLIEDMLWVQTVNCSRQLHKNCFTKQVGICFSSLSSLSAPCQSQPLGNPIQYLARTTLALCLHIHIQWQSANTEMLEHLFLFIQNKTQPKPLRFGLVYPSLKKEIEK